MSPSGPPFTLNKLFQQGQQIKNGQPIVKLQPIVHTLKPKLNIGTSIPHETLQRTSWAILLHPNDLPSGYITKRVAEITSTKFVTSVSQESTHPVFRTNKSWCLGDNGTCASGQGESAPPHTDLDCLTPADRPQGSTGASGRNLLSQHLLQYLRGPRRAIKVQTIAIRATRLNVSSLRKVADVKIEANLRADAMLCNQKGAVAAVAVEATLRVETRGKGILWD